MTRVESFSSPDPVALRRAIARSFAAWFPILEGFDGARLERIGTMVRWRSSVPLPVFNGVMTDDETPVTDAWVDEVLEPFRASGVALLWADMQDRRDLAEMLRERGFEIGRPAAMAIDLTELPPLELPSGVEVREVDTDPEALRVATSISMRTNGFPEHAVEPMLLAVERMPDRRSLRNFLLFDDGQPVAASSLLLGAGVAGLYNVGTLESHRGRGLGSAVSIAAMKAARDLGMRVGVLQASAMGEPVYRRIGFETYGRQLWASGDPRVVEA